jgi:hypothetical protein
MRRSGCTLASLATASLFIVACTAGSGDRDLTGSWLARYDSDNSLDGLTLEADHTFTAYGWPIELECHRPEHRSDYRATGRWRLAPDSRRLDLDYDAPALRTCKVPKLTSLVVDTSGGDTDLLIYPDGANQLSSRIRLSRRKPPPPPSAASLASNQVECFRAEGRWTQVCMARQYSCLARYRDGGTSCTDSSQCQGKCLVDMTAICNPGVECTDPVKPEPGQAFVGQCQRDAEPCGSFIEIRKGQAEPAYHID